MTTTTHALASWLFKLGFWVPFAVCTYLALAPQPPQVDMFRLSDIFAHAFAFAYLTFAFRVAYQNRSAAHTFVVLLAYGVLIEVVQSFEAERSAEIKDLLVDVAGIGLGLLIARLGRDRLCSFVRRVVTATGLA